MATFINWWLAALVGALTIPLVVVTMGPLLNTQSNNLLLVASTGLATGAALAVGQFISIRRYLVRPRVWIFGTIAIGSLGPALFYLAYLAVRAPIAQLDTFSADYLYLLFWVSLAIVPGLIGWTQSFAFLAAREIRPIWTVVTAVAYTLALFTGPLLLWFFRRMDNERR